MATTGIESGQGMEHISVERKLPKREYLSARVMLLGVWSFLKMPVRIALFLKSNRQAAPLMEVQN